MSPGDVLDLSRESVYVLIKVSTPILLTALVVGLLISLLQALTQIQEMTLSFVPKILSIFFILIMCLPYIGQSLGDFFGIIIGLIAIKTSYQ